MVKDAVELADKISEILSNDHLRHDMGERGKLVIREQTDIMNKTVEYVMAAIKAHQ